MTAWRGGRLAAVVASLVSVGALALSGCSAAGAGDGGIVVTTNILGDVTREIAGDQTEVTVLMQPGADPHSFAISARESAIVEQAGLLVHNGLGLEEGVQRNVDAAVEAGVPALAVAEQVDPVRFSGGDSGGEADPHFWTDPQRMRTAVEHIRDRIVSDVDGIDEDAVRANARAYLAKLDELDGWMNRQFDRIPDDQRTLVTNHHVFGYLAQRYDFTVLGAVIPSGTTLASPSASDLEDLAGTVREAGVRAIFADSSQPDRLAQVLADRAGVDVQVRSLHSESLTGGDGGAPTYLAMMRANTEAIVDGLTGS
ncbi:MULTISPECIES: zinc ABC transporter substrate-binding protein AztC [Prauserella salsuginis group]|uniref:Zinc/manganese transport system substrate-binding protein n=2 Tax=Prauserella salsuginis group TaxID=2893672 RepID=A0A839XN68_9PSEU|nr:MULTISPECIES: zinc ABC transporter substrate-binding protein AztC [Prauserella salsuginis group]MBB3665302.1 zinc/manganese transport system substrate-binding protein [Prauserella sediminis]MCR3723063.1 zinc/manganese transport system substrate-binding protein [Prauserella flava]MCR3732562.1 zinc/manganese transport system substrate-binding protein [Prauserella salsuginis]